MGWVWLHWPHSQHQIAGWLIPADGAQLHGVVGWPLVG